MKHELVKKKLYPMKHKSCYKSQLLVLGNLVMIMHPLCWVIFTMEAYLSKRRTTKLDGSDVVLVT